MREYPLLCLDSVVRNILARTQTQDRRPITWLRGFGDISLLDHWGRPSFPWRFRDKRGFWNELDDARFMEASKWVKGDRLWVREAYKETYDIDGRDIVAYRAGGTRLRSPDGKSVMHGEHRVVSVLGKWHPNIHMPRSVCRLVLDVLDVRAEQLCDISEADAMAEGCSCRAVFFDLMITLYGPDVLIKWVRSTTFKVLP